MYAARQPMHVATLMHGCTPVSASPFNHAYNDSNNNPHFSSFTKRQSHAAHPPDGTPRQSHGFVFDNSQIHPPLHHNGKDYTQSDRSSAKRQMSENRYSHLPAPNATLAGSLLCSSWPSFLPIEPTTLPTGMALPDASAAPYRAQTQTPQLNETDPAFSSLEEIFSSSSASLHDPTPGLTPNSSLGSTPATSIDIFGDHKLAKTSQGVSQQSLEGFRRIQPKPPELPSRRSETNAVLSSGIPDTLVDESAPHAIPSLEELFEWPQSANADFSADNFAQVRQFQGAELGLTASDHDSFDIAVPAALDSYDGFVDLDTFETFNDGMPAAYPDLPGDFDPFSSLDGNGYASAVSQSSLSSSSDPFMPPIMVESDAMAMAAFDGRPYTANLGADNAMPLVGPFSQTAPIVAGSVHGEGSRRDTTRDDELIELRAKGLSYRDIKLYHGFDVAESTLRGRMRSLMKRKEERVRKPTWKPENIQLLCNCVMEYAIQQHLPSEIINCEGIPFLKSEQATNKVSWKKVAKAMADRGSYHYGNATVKKKYMDLWREKVSRRQ